MIRKTEMENSHGIMGDVMKDSGKMEYNMELDNTLVIKKEKDLRKEDGRMGN